MVSSVISLAFAAAVLPLVFGQTVINPGFELDGESANDLTGITGWTDVVNPNGDGGWFTFNAADAVSFKNSVDAGTYSLSSGSSDPANQDTIYQSFTGLTKQCYDITFDFSNGGVDGLDPQTGAIAYGITFSFGSAAPIDLYPASLAFQQQSEATGPSPNSKPPNSLTPYNTYTFTLPATGNAAQDAISFTSYSLNQYPGLDQVSIAANPNAVTGYNGVACKPAGPSVRARRSNTKRFNHGGVQW